MNSKPVAFSILLVAAFERVLSDRFQGLPEEAAHEAAQSAAMAAATTILLREEAGLTGAFLDDVDVEISMRLL